MGKTEQKNVKDNSITFKKIILTLIIIFLAVFSFYVYLLHNPPIKANMTINSIDEKIIRNGSKTFKNKIYLNQEINQTGILYHLEENETTKKKRWKKQNTFKIKNGEATIKYPPKDEFESKWKIKIPEIQFYLTWYNTLTKTISTRAYNTVTLPLNCKSACIMKEDNTILYNKNMNKQKKIGTISKLMTYLTSRNQLTPSEYIQMPVIDKIEKEDTDDTINDNVDNTDDTTDTDSETNNDYDTNENDDIIEEYNTEENTDDSDNYEYYNQEQTDQYYYNNATAPTDNDDSDDYDDTYNDYSDDTDSNTDTNNNESDDEYSEDTEETDEELLPYDIKKRFFKGSNNDYIKIYDLYRALLLENADDAAFALAIETANSPELFGDKMITNTKKLKLKNTKISSPDGYFGGEKTSTAKNLCTILKKCFNSSPAKDILSEKKTHIVSQTGNVWQVKIKDKILKLYKVAGGFVENNDTGNGWSIVFKYTHNNKNYYISIIGSKSRYAMEQDCYELLNYIFERL